MSIRVISKHWALEGEKETAFYVGRGSPLGNPFKVKPHGPHERGETIPLYEQHLRERISAGDPNVRAELNRIYQHAREHDETLLMCYCAPRACHADIIKKIIEEKL